MRVTFPTATITKLRETASKAARRALLEAQAHLAVHQTMRGMTLDEVDGFLALVKTKNLINFLARYKNTPLYLMTGELYAKVSHGLKGALFGVDNFTELLQHIVSKEGVELDRSQLLECINLMRLDLDFAKGIFESLAICFKAMGKDTISKGINVNDLITKRQNFHKTFTWHRDIQLEFILASDLQLCDLDESKIEHVIINLLINAYQATINSREIPKTITITTRNVPFNGTSGIEITIRDNGCGLPAGKEDKVFEPFFTTKEREGTGLGLTVSRDIIEMHHGSLTIANNSDGPGVTVTIQLPTKQPSRE